MRVTDAGLFGPDSVSWRVHAETTVLFGGARAILMQAAHPLVIAGATATGFYERNPWQRLERTLRLTYAITFGTRDEAMRAVERINEVHRSVHGIDTVTGKRYDALDPELLLWVHAVLVDSTLLFEELTVGALGGSGRQRFHEEQMQQAELLGIPRAAIPPTVPALRAWIDGVIARGDLVVTDASRRVADLFLDPPPEAAWRPVLRLVARLAFGTLPPPLRSAYGIRRTPARAAGMAASLAVLRALHPLIPPRLRFIRPALDARARLSEAGTDRNPTAG